MPDRIKHLPQELANQIAAGEVVERPASVLKELIENAIDAESKHISVKIEKGGTRLISVADDGIGMSSKDAVTAFGRHATSKLSSKDDLFNIHTLGFRGEALASIAAVARVRLKTRERGSETGTCVEIEGGDLIKSVEAGCPEGSEIEVRDIFFNVPARKGFLKGTATELGHMLNIVTHTALAYNDIHLTLVNTEKNSIPLLDFPPVKRLEDRIFQIYGSDVLEGLVGISPDSEGDSGGYSVRGLVSKPSLTFTNKENQLFFVNKRPIRNPAVSHAVQSAYSDLVPGARYPMVVLFIDIDPLLVDVNVHPSKREVKFRDGRYVHDMIVEAIREGLQIKGQGKAHEYRASAGSVRYEVHEEVLNPFAEKTEYYEQQIPGLPFIKVLGQIDALFIIAEIDGELNIIDQHAAHERVIYDRLKKSYASGNPEAQLLLIPDTIELSPDRSEVLMAYKESLIGLGFDIEEMGGRSFMIRSVPAAFTGEDCVVLITHMIDEIMDMEPLPEKDIRFTSAENIIKALLSRKACHAAVRAKGLLSNGEMSTLLSALLRTDMPYTCPHGRTIVKRFSSDELARLFGRK